MICGYNRWPKRWPREIPCNERWPARMESVWAWPYTYLCQAKAFPGSNPEVPEPFWTATFRRLQFGFYQWECDPSPCGPGTAVHLFTRILFEDGEPVGYNFDTAIEQSDFTAWGSHDITVPFESTNPGGRPFFLIRPVFRIQNFTPPFQDLDTVWNYSSFDRETWP